jgi:hypothetical protein
VSSESTVNEAVWRDFAPGATLPLWQGTAHVAFDSDDPEIKPEIARGGYAKPRSTDDTDRRCLR